LNHHLVRAVVTSVPEGSKVLDLFSGAGNFALGLAAAGCPVVAVEGDSLLTEDGRRNARENDLTGIRFVTGDLSRPAPGLIQESGADFDVAVMDPPRSGVSAALIAWILEAHIPTLRYVSCDPATLARDLSRLARDYNVSSVRVVDLFPQTSHIESLAVLEKI